MSIKLDRSLPYGTVYGGDPTPVRGKTKYVQGGAEFDYEGNFIPPKPVPRKDYTIETDELVSARAFLSQILKSGPLSKAQCYKAAEDNNQTWGFVKQASEDLKLVKFKYRGSEMWKLPDA